MMGNKKWQVWLPLLFSVVMVIGMLLGYRLGSKGGPGFFSSGSRNPLQEVLDLVRLKYVDTVQLDSLTGHAIEDIVNELDPHSVYLPPVDLKAANEDLAGRFEGIGVEFNLFKDTVHVVYVIPGGPSDRAGLQIGDRILSVNDSVLAGKSFGIEDIKNRIRGPRGSEARLKIERDKTIRSIPVTRGAIPVPSVDAAYMLDKTTGYIRLNRFTETSYEEFMKALETLQKQGLQSLIYDLRGNGGGFMNEAVDMADEFLDGDKLIVYTEGANSKKREYRCKRPGLFEKGKLVLLVDELSASASEVLAGALQDWCRATIVGRRTFGKGLVQEQYSLSNGSAIRLTVARYYTPLGRSIQRSYEKGKKVYMDDLWDRFNSGELVSRDSVRNHQNGTGIVNACRDTLYAGGGITPQVFIALDTTAHQYQLNGLFSGTHLNRFVYNYYLQHKTALDGYRSAADFNSRFPDTENMWNEWVRQAERDSIRVSKLTPGQQAWLKTSMKALLSRFRWRTGGMMEILNTGDEFIQKSLPYLK